MKESGFLRQSLLVTAWFLTVYINLIINPSHIHFFMIKNPGQSMECPESVKVVIINLIRQLLLLI